MSFFILKMNQLSLQALINGGKYIFVLHSTPFLQYININGEKMEIALFNFNHSVLQIPLLCCSAELQSILGPILFSGMVHSY